MVGMVKPSAQVSRGGARELWMSWLVKDSPEMVFFLGTIIELNGGCSIAMIDYQSVESVDFYYVPIVVRLVWLESHGFVYIRINQPNCKLCS